MKYKQIFLLLMTYLFLVPAFVAAQQNPRPLLKADGTEFLVEQLSDSQHPRINLEAGHSYCCETYRSSMVAGTDLSYPRFAGVSRTNLEDGFGSSIQFTKRGLTSPIVSYHQAEFNAHPDPDGQRLCVMPATNGLYTFVFRLGLDEAPLNNVNDFYMRCHETTLFGGFNTSVTNFNFLEVRNTTNANISGFITAINTVTGQTVISNRPFSVAGGRRVDVSIHDAAGSGSFGTIKLRHDGPYGSIHAQVVQYNINAQNPAQFVPVAQEVLKPRY